MRMSELDKQKELVKKLNIIDDTFFHKLVEDVGVCEEMLRTILEDDSIEVISSEPQKYLRNTQARSVILDVLCKDASGRRMNIEVQKADNGDHQRRVRYNGSNIDTYMTEKGIGFDKIPDVYIIFISKFDIFAEGRTVYHIDRVIRETGTVVTNGFYEIYLNTEYDDGSETASLLQYMKKTQGENKSFPRLSRRVRYFKEEQKGVSAMCELIEQYAQERAREAAKEAARETARELFYNGASYEIVRKSLKSLTKEELDRIYEEICVHS